MPIHVIRRIALIAFFGGIIGGGLLIFLAKPEPKAAPYTETLKSLEAIQERAESLQRQVQELELELEGTDR